MSSRLTIWLFAIFCLTRSLFASDSVPKLIVYVDDPDVGLAGVVRQDDDALYFQVEKRGTNDAVAEIAARILDRDGRLVAILAAASDWDGDPWLRGQQYRPRTTDVTTIAAAAVEALRPHRFTSATNREKEALLLLVEHAKQAPNARLPLAVTFPERRARLNAHATGDRFARQLPPAAIELLPGSSVDTRLHGRFGDDIYFETLQRITVDPDGINGERVETYGRFFDSAGATIGASAGGDDLPLEWQTTADEPVGADAALIDMSLTRAGRVAAAARSIHRELSGMSEFNDDIQALLSVGAAFEEHLLPMWDPSDVPTERHSPRRQENVRSLASTMYWYKQTVSVWSGGIAFDNQVAEHTATLIISLRSQKSSGPFVAFTTQSNVNHGRPWNGERMRWVKEFTTSAKTSYIAWVGKCASTKTWLSGCGVGNVSGNGCTKTAAMKLTSHNCHDDSLVQFWTIKNGVQYDPCGNQCTNCEGYIWTPTSKF